jgi:hypothetical protein
MKKATLLFGALSLMALVSCKKEEKEVDVDAPAADTTIVVHETAPAPVTTDTVVVKPEESDGTSVKINSDGLDINSKDGTKKTSVNVSKDNAGVEIKK